MNFAALVNEWWNRRLLAGTQLHDPSAFIKGWDYKGEGPWFNAIVPNALYISFSNEMNQNMQSYMFGKHFKTVASGVMLKHARATLLGPDGRVRVRSSRPFYVFDPKPILDDDLRRVLDGVASDKTNGE